MTDLSFARLAAASYDAAPAGQVIDWRDCRAVVTGSRATIRGTVPTSWENWIRDLWIVPAECATHPTIGDCPAGPLDAAVAFSVLLPPEVDEIGGHSLGGQVATQIAGIWAASGRPVRTLVTWDAPKAGGDKLIAALSAVAVREYRFLGSIVTDWPVFLDRHVRPQIAMGAWTPDPVEAHSIARAVAWLEARGAAAA